MERRVLWGPTIEYRSVCFAVGPDYRAHAILATEQLHAAWRAICEASGPGNARVERQDYERKAGCRGAMRTDVEGSGKHVQSEHVLVTEMEKPACSPCSLRRVLCVEVVEAAGRRERELLR
eukprot:3650002-Prymnesium_polylepis.1